MHKSVPDDSGTLQPVDKPMGGLEGRRPATSIVVLATAVASPRFG